MKLDSSGEKLKGEILFEEIRRRKERKKTVDVEEEKVKIVIFSLSGNLFAFYGSYVKEIFPLLNIYFVPGIPDFILGMVNIRGDVESVLTIHGFLGIPASEKSARSRILMTEKDEIRSGILVDSIDDVMDVPVNSVKPLLSSISGPLREFVLGSADYNGQNVFFLDIGKILLKAKI